MGYSLMRLTKRYVAESLPRFIAVVSHDTPERKGNPCRGKD